MTKKYRVLISKCLLGYPCRYDAKSVGCIDPTAYENIVFIPVCPEQLGGLLTPRPASEIYDGKVINNINQDVTDEFCLGAKITLDTAISNNIDFAVLKSKSPSCGKGKIYDGSFKGILTDGNGITAQLLLDNNIEVMDEHEFINFINNSKE